MTIKAAVSSQDMTCFIPGIGMMGYGQPHNTVEEIATPLTARILLIDRSATEKFILAHLEQAFVTLAIKEEVLKRLQLLYPDWNLTYANVAITAQHTHSAPGGYSHYPFYNFTIPGFQTRVLEKIVSAILAGITEAAGRLREADFYWGEHTVAADKEIAFNRSMRAQAQNPEARHFKEEEKHLAVDRTMTGLRVCHTDGKEIAFLNWFGVHCTSVSSFNKRIHYDNKGVAAKLFEVSHPGVTAFFLQKAAGDVSPNFIRDTKSGLMRGKFSDQYESAAYNGELQFREAEKINSDKKISENFYSDHIFFDMEKNVAPLAHGVAFFKGTAEGPGVSEGLGSVLSLLSKVIRKFHLIKNPEAHRKFYDAHGNKDVLLDHRTGAFLGIPLSVWEHLPPLPEPSVEALRKTAKAQALRTLPWAPPILPFQILRLGEILIAFVPGEITTYSAARLKEFIESKLSSDGIKNVIISSYANAFMGYIVTPEEYDQQCYEGGHCIYGRNTLSGVITAFSILIDRYQGKICDVGLPPKSFHFPPDELARRTV